MKRYLAIVYLIICLPSLAWLALTFFARNTYFRAVYTSVKQNGDPYRESLSGGDALAWHLFVPAIALVLFSMGVVILFLLPQKTKQ
jgi:hypothetical protein